MKNEQMLDKVNESLNAMANLISAAKCYNCQHKYTPKEKLKPGGLIPATIGSGETVLPVQACKRRRGRPRKVTEIKINKPMGMGEDFLKALEHRIIHGDKIGGGSETGLNTLQ